MHNQSIAGLPSPPLPKGLAQTGKNWMIDGRRTDSRRPFRKRLTYGMRWTWAKLSQAKLSQAELHRAKSVPAVCSCCLFAPT